MAGVIGEVNGTPKVSRWEDGRLLIWAGPAEDGVALLVDEAGAIELAKRLLAEVGRQDRPDFAAIVERIRIDPPQHGVPGRLTIEAAGQSSTLLIEWPDLIGLAEAANSALKSVRPDGES